MTQENNPAWGIDSSGTAYQNSVTEFLEVPNTSGTAIYSNQNKTEVYFERPTTDSYWSTFASGVLPTVSLYSGTGYSPTVYSTSTMIQDTQNTGWYKFTYTDHATMQANSTIKIIDGTNSTYNSGYLYYFSTQKVFICTN